MGSTLVFSSGGEGETLALAAAVAAILAPGDVVALSGELGAGKTRFVEGACRALGYQGRVRSPSYTLLNIYRGRMPIHHLDLYRWEREGREVEIEEWREVLEGDGVTFIEWAERLGGELPPHAIRVRIVSEGETRRRLEIEAPGARLAPLGRGQGSAARPDAGGEQR